MKVNVFLSVAITFFMFFSACKSENSYQKLDSGLEFRFFRKAEPAKPAKQGDIILVRFNIFHEDSLLESTAQIWGDVDMQIQVPKFKGGIEDAFLMMSAGDSAHFLIDAHKFYINNKKMPAPDFIKVGEKLRFEIGLKKIYTTDEVQTKIDEEIKQLQREELETLTNFIVTEEINEKPLSSGIYILKKVKSSGKQAKKGDIAVVHYTGRLLDGRVFDSSVARNTPFEFKIGAGEVIPSWDEAVATMNVHEKIVLITPSSQAYGAQGAGAAIPPFSSLAFEIELLELK